MTKLAYYSDLHLEFGNPFKIPKAVGRQADVLILAGDILSFNQPEVVIPLLEHWPDNKPVLFVPGNHEYYHNSLDNIYTFQHWLVDNNLANVHVLHDEPFYIHDVSFFGGTMWTDFNDYSLKDVSNAMHTMNDFRVIKNNGHLLTPEDTIALHDAFRQKLIHWFKECPKFLLNDKDKDYPEAKAVVITHHQPVANPYSQYLNSPLRYAFQATDMLDVILEYQPDLWIYGHTHEQDNQMIEHTRIVSNQFGYYSKDQIPGFIENCIIEV